MKRKQFKEKLWSVGIAVNSEMNREEKYLVLSKWLLKDGYDYFF